jgi:phage terminase large subunit-like protein
MALSDNKFKLSKLDKNELKVLRTAAEERFDFFNAVFLDTILQPFHQRWFEFQMSNPRTLVLGPRGSWKCVGADTLIPTRDGLQYIKEVLPYSDVTLPFSTSTDFILGSCLGEAKATQLFSNGLDTILEIETEDGFILKSTPEHRWLVWDGYHLKFREARYLTPHERFVFRCNWRCFTEQDSNPFNVAPELWFSALSFFYATYPNGWHNIWRATSLRKKIGTPLWRHFNHKEWKSLPPEFEKYLQDNGFNNESPLLPKPLRACTFAASRTIAKSFWRYNRYIKFTEAQAIEVQKWFLNLGFPLHRSGATLLQKSPALRKYFWRMLNGHSDTCDYTEDQLAELAGMLAVEIQRDPFVLPILKFKLEKECKLDFKKNPTRARQFVEENISIVPGIKNFSFLFKFPHFLQRIKKITKSHGLTVDLTTSEGNYLANGAVCHNSTILGQHYAIWRALRDPNIRIGLISKSSLLSSSFLSKIKSMLETNAKMQMVWPDLIQPMKAQKWNNAEVSMIRSMPLAEATFTALGVGSTLAGKHFDILIFDDIVDVESRDSAALRRKIWDWFRFVAMPTLSVSHETEAHVIGTAYHREDLYHRILLMEADQGGWKSMVQAAIQDDGTSFWEDQFPLDKLQQIESMYGPDVFRLQYQNDIDFSSGSGLIEADDFEMSYYEPHEAIPENLDIVMGVDLAAPGTDKTEKHSMFAIAVIGQERGTSRTFLLDFIQRRNLRLADQKDLVTSMYLRYPHMHSIQIEAYAVQTYFHEYLTESETVLPVVKVHTSGSKESRFEFLTHLIKSQKLLIRREYHNEFINEMVSFPNTSADLIDAVYIAVKGLIREPNIRFVSLW